MIVLIGHKLGTSILEPIAVPIHELHQLGEGQILLLWRAHQPTLVSINSLALATPRTGRSSSLVEEMLKVERRQLCWQR